MTDFRAQAETLIDNYRASHRDSEENVTIALNVFSAHWTSVFTATQLVKLADALYSITLTYARASEALETLRAARVLRYNTRTMNKEERSYEIRFK